MHTEPTATTDSRDELVPTGLTCDALTLEGRACVEPLDEHGACPEDAGHDPAGDRLVEEGSSRLLVAAVRRQERADRRSAGRTVGEVARPGRPLDDVHDVHPSQAGTPNTLAAVAVHRDRYALAEDDRAQYVSLSAAHGDLAHAVGAPTSSPWAVPAALVTIAARGLAWLDTLDTGQVLRVVAGERIAQRRKHPTATLDLPGLDDPARFVVLAEEVGEVANALTYDEGDPANLVRELVQVVALALAWLDGLDEREGTVR